MEPSASHRKRRKREKTKKIQKTTQTSHDNNDISESEPIPPDIIFEILSKLSMESIVRFQSVSKLWSSITATPEFTKARSSPSPPRVLLLFQKRERVFAFSSPTQESNNPDNPYPPRVVSCPYECLYNCFDSVYGFVCLRSLTQFKIWNPTTGRVFTLPKLECDERSIANKFLLGYGSVDDEYKALSILRGSSIGILTLGAQESWRFISTRIPKHVPLPFAGVHNSVICIDGFIYYEAFMCLAMKHAIMSFDLRSEELSLIKHPNREKRCLLVSYEGRLALVTSISSGVELWILEDAENHEWSHKSFSSPPPPYEKWMLKGVTDAGEFIYIYTPFSTFRFSGKFRGSSEVIHVEKSLHESFSVMYFDPTKKTTREVKFGGIGCDDIRRLDEVGFNIRDDLIVIPNHIESLMSL
ncbi:unnamed protein product [Microthlaspi erraticum]|uniref:F-box domain-containing protein n=1 Tax=Microthlaspi erraticum TaxID=1685480 RepID=A0A6D2K4C7_9BRAS|nr:unnamed protein product [Microthlaspi erraticum]